MNRDQKLSLAARVVLCILLAVISFFILGRKPPSIKKGEG